MSRERFVCVSWPSGALPWCLDLYLPIIFSLPFDIDFPVSSARRRIPPRFLLRTGKLLGILGSMFEFSVFTLALLLIRLSPAACLLKRRPSQSLFRHLKLRRTPRLSSLEVVVDPCILPSSWRHCLHLLRMNESRPIIPSISTLCPSGRRFFFGRPSD